MMIEKKDDSNLRLVPKLKFLIMRGLFVGLSAHFMNIIPVYTVDKDTVAYAGSHKFDPDCSCHPQWKRGSLDGDTAVWFLEHNVVN